MTRAVAIEHGCTSLLGMVILVLIASGTMTFGYGQMFRKPLGRVVMGLRSAPTITPRPPASGPNDEVALPGDPPGQLEVVDGMPEGGKIPELDGNYGAFAPDYAPEEIFEIASKLYTKGRCSPTPETVLGSRQFPPCNACPPKRGQAVHACDETQTTAYAIRIGSVA